MKEKWIVFRDYYLKGTIIAIIIIVGLTSYFVYSKVTAKENVLQVLMMDVQCPLEQHEEFEKEAGEIIGVESEKEYVDISFNQSMELFTALMTGSTADIFLMDKNNFEKVLSWECLKPLDATLGEELEQKELDNELTIYRGEDEKIYGFSVKDNSWIKQFEFVSYDDIIIGVADGAPNMENIYEILEFLMEK